MATSLLRRRIVEDFEHDMGLKLRRVSGQRGLVLAYRAIGKLRTVCDGIARAIREALRPRPCSIVGGLATDLLRTRAELVAENALLRQQLVVVARRVNRPIFRRHERAPVALLTAVLPRWKDALLLVQPETVLRWHREGVPCCGAGSLDRRRRQPLASRRT